MGVCGISLADWKSLKSLLGERAYPSVEHSGRWWWPSYDMFTVAIIVVRVGDERRGFGKQELGCQASQ